MPSTGVNYNYFKIFFLEHFHTILSNYDGIYFSVAIQIKLVLIIEHDFFISEILPSIEGNSSFGCILLQLVVSSGTKCIRTN
jgi:hypothetical protein